ncbi:MAG TPA: EAL domain-containing protein, partial [Rhodocyclaceae bacterium]|nr:EAL domain-containing protein [Rhodocyclaceae bacterium]
ERLALEGALRRALGSDQLAVVYQPKIDSIGRVVGFEALLRWLSPEFGQVSPARFIPIAEETGLIKPLTDYVLEAACRAAAGWGDLHVAVNLSARQFAAEGLVDQVSRILQDTALPATHLQLEITESMLVGDIERTVDTLTRLKVLGVRIAVDDFGTGYSSLAYLKRFPIDILKIDRSFVMECERDADAMAIPRGVIALGHSLGLRIVAEGVEKQAQLDVLNEHGCEEFQGFLISPPLPPEKIPDFLALRRHSSG